MNCETCAGACCESFAIPASDLRPPGLDERVWIELHGKRDGRYLIFETRCTALTPGGRCAIYDDRPNVCRVFEPGGHDCLATVRARRTAAQYAAIRGPADPPTIHAREV